MDRVRRKNIEWSVRNVEEIGGRRWEADRRREGGAERRREIHQQKDFAALAVNRIRREAQRKHTCQQPVITRQSSAHRPVQGLTKRTNGGRNSIKKWINKQAVFPLDTGTGKGAGSGMCMQVSHWKTQGDRDLIGVDKSEEIRGNAMPKFYDCSMHTWLEHTY